MKELSVKEKLQTAIYTLVTTKGDIRDCINKSYQEVEMITEDEIPNELKDKWHLLQSRLSVSSNHINSENIQYSLKKLKLDECVQIAELINELGYKINLR